MNMPADLVFLSVVTEPTSTSETPASTNIEVSCLEYEVSRYTVEYPDASILGDLFGFDMLQSRKSCRLVMSSGVNHVYWYIGHYVLAIRPSFPSRTPRLHIMLARQWFCSRLLPVSLPILRRLFLGKIVFLEQRIDLICIP